MSNTGYRGIVAALIASSLSVGQAAVLRVPGDYILIQSAIDASRNGDVVLVSPGVYTESIRFKGKGITLSSTNPADPNVVSGTIIHAAARRSVVTFANSETSNSVLTGFTITGGYGTINTSFSTDVYWGGGIYCYRSSPTIIGNIIMANFAPTGRVGSVSSYGYGCGIGCLESDATITRNLIMGNDGYAGGGITASSGKARIANNMILSNSAVFGGGVALFSGGQLINNTVMGNRADFAGNVYATSDASAQSLVTDNIICNALRGGGIYAGDKFTKTAFNDVWNNTDGDYLAGNKTGVDGNISVEPAFVDPENGNYRLRDVSACINAGEPNFQEVAGETDFYGGPRLYARRVDIGAAEYFDNFRPLADAGPDQLIGVTRLPASIALDGSASSDLNGAALSYRWRQLSGPTGSFNDAGAAKPVFNVLALGTYTFELIVNNGSFNSFVDTVEVIVKNDAPTANAGDDQLYSDLDPINSISLDGSASFDPENAPLTYHWNQIGGWKILLSDPSAVKPTFDHPWPGIYLFELVVNDGMQNSTSDIVAVVIGPNHAPVADAGLPRYVATGSVTLDGTRSYDPDGYGTLRYQWTQVSGPAVTITGTNTPTPVVSGFTPKTTIQQCVFELVVSDGKLVSPPSSTAVIIVHSFGTNALKIINPPFDPAKPTIVAFGGGNCSTGSGMTFGGVWEEQANWITVDSYAVTYDRYGDMLIAYLNSLAPDYRKPIQTIGFSTGNLPAMSVAWYVNTTYKDARYAVNRVSLLDAVCSGSSILRVLQFNTNRVAAEQGWVDNYISNDPNYSRASVFPGTFNIVCNPPRYHSYPVERYSSSSLDYENGGMTAFGYLSVIGAGKNYQLNTSSNKYYFVINSAESLVFFNESSYPGKTLAPVQLTGPVDGHTLDTRGVTLGCETVENAVGYQLLLGPTPDRVMDYTIISDTSAPPTQTITTLPQEYTWWTVRAYDQFGSTIYADPRLIKLPANNPPTADAGPDQIVYAGLDGRATITLDGSKSTDPDGDRLGFTWAWAIGANAYLSNGLSLAIELPVGVHTVQLSVSDGHGNSRPDEVKITVVAPLECKLKIAPSAINLRSSSPHILASIRFPDGVTSADVVGHEPLVIYPGGIQAIRELNPSGQADQASVVAFFGKDGLSGELQNGPAELTVVGKLRSGQMFYGRDTVEIIGAHKND